MKKGYIFIYLLAVFMVACSSEEVLVHEGNSDTRADNSEATIRLTFPASGSPNTRALTAADENKITSIDLIVFTKDANNDLLDDKYAYKIAVSSVDISDHASATNGDVKTISVKLKNMPSVKQRILLLANIPSELRSVIDDLDDSDEGVTTEQEIISRLRFNGAPWRVALTSGNHTPFPMFGQMFDYVSIDHEHPITGHITINMIRSMARIDVKVDNSATGYGTAFLINNIHLYNASDSGYVAPHNDYISHAPENTSIGKTNPSPKRITSAVYTFPSGRELSRSIYVPESDSLMINGIDSIKPAFLVIEALYNGNTRYYRIDFTSGATFIPLLRNHNYVINILNIKTDGYATLIEAVNAPLATLNLSISIEGANSDINDISTYNDEYLLGLSVNEVMFDWEQNCIGGGAEYRVRVYSTYPDEDHPEWSVVSASTGFTAVKENATTLKITANSKNYTGREVTPAGKVVLRAGLITKEITVRQTGGANSIVANFGTQSEVVVRIPLGFLAAAKSTTFNGKTIADFKDSIVWQESNTGITFETTLSTGSPAEQQYITVRATSSTANKYANAVIGLTWKVPGGPGYVGSDEPDAIVWSWHIWTMPGSEVGYSSGGNVNSDFHNPNTPLLMKRVLGKGAATHPGLHYQWGRKDPFFRGLTGITPAVFYADTVKVNDNKNNATLRPSAFFNGTVLSNYDWMGVVHENDLWSDSSTPATKTFYDPCPEGWRVPPRYDNITTSPWQNDVNIVRAEYDNGSISSGNGVFILGGYLWTATVLGMQAYYTKIPTSGAVTHTGTAERASGLSVRCVKDLERKY